MRKFGVMIFITLMVFIALASEKVSLDEFKHSLYIVHVLKNDFVEIRYPEFVLEDFQIQTKLNEKIKETVMGMFNSWKPVLESNIEEGFADRTFYLLTFEIKKISDRVISILFQDYGFTGGAHGMHYWKALNFDLKEGKEIKLSDLFEKGTDYLKQLEGFVKDYFEHAEGVINPFTGFKKEPQFYIVSKYLVIFFQVYEYTAYAYGNPEISVYYKRLKGVKDEYFK